jgi:hypothetical protein
MTSAHPIHDSKEISHAAKLKRSAVLGTLLRTVAPAITMRNSTDGFKTAADVAIPEVNPR